MALDVRRLAAVDMHGTRLGKARPRIILAEFVLGAAGGLVLGAVVLVTASTVVGVLVGLWALGVGANYVPLARYAVLLSRPGALADEMAGADVRRELAYYTKAQMWVLVPLALVVFELRAGRGRRGERERSR